MLKLLKGMIEIEKIVGIYKITNKVNGKSYVGQSIDIHKRWENHRTDLKHNRSSSPILQSAWNKYGKENFVFEILEVCDKSELNDKEMSYIKKFNSFKNGYNCSIGGEGSTGRIVSQKEREAMSIRSKLQFQDPKQREYLSRVMKQRIENDPNLFKTHYVCLNTMETFYGTKAGSILYNIGECTIRDSANGKVEYCTNKNKIRMSFMKYEDFLNCSNNELKKRFTTALYKKGSDKNKKKVRCINTDEIFDYSKEACEKYNANRSNLNSCCNGKRRWTGKHPETNEWLRWEYI